MPALAPEVEEILLGRRWPGNVRELANVLERGTILAGGGELRAEHIAPEPAAPAPTLAAERAAHPPEPARFPARIRPAFSTKATAPS